MLYLRFQVFVLFILAAVPLGIPSKPLSPRWDDMHTKHSWNAVPKRWETLGHPPSNTTIDLYVALKSHRENALVDVLYEVSSPGNPKYGAHLSKEQVAELVAPHPTTLNLVNSWIEHQGIPSSTVSMTHGGNTLMLKGLSMAQANTLLGASYQVYKHIESRETIIRTIGYALPAALHEHVLTVVPTTSFVSRPTRSQNRPGGEAATSTPGEPAVMLPSRDNVNSLWPEFLRDLYGTETYVHAALDRNELGIVGYLEDYPSPTDLGKFMGKYCSRATEVVFAVQPVNGEEYDPEIFNEEANLDMQYAQGIAYPTPHIFYSTSDGESGTDDWFITWLRYILDEPIVPQTISTSYGIAENAVSRGYADYVCDLFAKLGSRGVSVLFPSGDHGVGEGSCESKDGKVQFEPFFPASCPYVTAVGGTTNFEPELAARISGGGFSNYFLRPDYQKDAVDAFFLDLGDRYQGQYNDSGRGFPDIAAQAFGFQIFLNGKEKQVSGTSGATPVVAGVISLVNDFLISKDRAPLGFLNPWLYGSGFHGLNDITYGSNPGCKTDGFYAMEGWDPVTGLGTPYLEVLLERALKDSKPKEQPSQGDSQT